ncbi:hypothetical protein K8I31_22165 [bacterium]|nr:hypothetical protein [bacterium]
MKTSFNFFLLFCLLFAFSSVQWTAFAQDQSLEDVLWNAISAGKKQSDVIKQQAAFRCVFDVTSQGEFEAQPRRDIPSSRNQTIHIEALICDGDLLLHKITDKLDSQPPLRLDKTCVWHKQRKYYEVDHTLNSGFITPYEEAPIEHYTKLFITGRDDFNLFQYALVGMSDPAILKKVQAVIVEYPNEPEKIGDFLVDYAIETGPSYFSSLTKKLTMTCEDGRFYLITDRAGNANTYCEFMIDSEYDYLVIQSRQYAKGELVSSTIIHDVTKDSATGLYYPAKFSSVKKFLGQETVEDYANVKFEFIDDPESVRSEFDIEFPLGATILDASKRPSKKYDFTDSMTTRDLVGIQPE